MQHKAIIIAGPTASGKTSLAIRLAQHFNTSIISADSRQCFRELSIGTAKPGPQELESAKHYFINSHHVEETVDAAVYEKLSLQYAKEIFGHNNIAIVCGGTGLYIKAFCEGLDEMPVIPREIRNAVREAYEKNGLAWLQKQLEAKGDASFNLSDAQNPQRLMRALEVLETTGKSIKDYQKREKVLRNFDIMKIGLALPKELLHQNINKRVDGMMEQGLIAEVKRLQPYRHLNALQTVGYKEIFTCLDGKISLEEAIEQIKVNTRRYAKRQMTWFRKDKAINWFDPRNQKDIIDFLNSSVR